MAKLTPKFYLICINAAAGSIEEKRWLLAELAAQAKQEGLEGWAETMATNSHVRRKPRTIRAWAQAFELREALPVKYDLDLTYFTRAVAYLDRLPEETIMSAMQDAVDNPDTTIEDYAAYLSGQTPKPEPEPVSLREALTQADAMLADILNDYGMTTGAALHLQNARREVATVVASVTPPSAQTAPDAEGERA